MNTCYIESMPIFEGKKNVTVTVKYSDAETAALKKLSELEDRSLSYIVRELSMRGLLQYLKDKKLKVTPEDIELAKNLIEGGIQTELTIGSKEQKLKKAG